MHVSTQVFVEGRCVEGQIYKDKAFPSQSEIEEVESIDVLIKGIQVRWGVNADINVWVWRNNFDR